MNIEQWKLTFGIYSLFKAFHIVTEKTWKTITTLMTSRDLSFRSDAHSVQKFAFCLRKGLGNAVRSHECQNQRPRWIKRWRRGGKRLERNVESPAYCECTIWKIQLSTGPGHGLNSTDCSGMLLGNCEPQLRWKGTSLHKFFSMNSGV